MTFMMLLQAISGIISLISVSIILAHYNVAAAMLGLATAVPFFVIHFIRGKAMYKAVRNTIPQRRIASYLYSIFTTKSQAKDIRMLHAESFLKEKWGRCHRDIQEALLRENRKSLFFNFFCECITILGLLIAILLSLQLTMSGMMSVGIFSACIYAFQSVQATTSSLFATVGRLPEKVSYINDYVSFVEIKNREDTTDSELRLAHEITIENVSFRYPQSEHFAVFNANLVLPAGKTTAIVGNNGSGKTTLSKLITGAYQPENGRVYWDKTDISTVGKQEIAKFCAIVSQPLNKYKFSVAEAIDLSRNSLDYEKIALSARTRLPARRRRQPGCPGSQDLFRGRGGSCFHPSRCVGAEQRPACP